MEYSKQTIIEALEHSIEKTKEEIEKYSKDCNGRFAQGRTAHREFLKKQQKKMEEQLKGVGRMNKQELIEKYTNYNLGGTSRKALLIRFLRDLDQLDEPQKPVVPQFVADWYEKHKDDLEYDIWEYILHWGKQQKSEFYVWMNNANNKPLQTLVNMHQFGYEVNKEKLYRVSIPKTRNHNKHTQFLCYSDGNIFFCGECTRFQTKFTRKELEKAGFSWVFDCPGIEIEEVE